jgi:hypothetical protein
MLCTKRVLPMPASPSITSTDARPSLSRRTAAAASASSASRPTSPSVEDTLTGSSTQAPGSSQSRCELPRPVEDRLTFPHSILGGWSKARPQNMRISRMSSASISTAMPRMIPISFGGPDTANVRTRRPSPRRRRRSRGSEWARPPAPDGSRPAARCHAIS